MLYNEKDYISKQIPYWNEQYILGSFSKEELLEEINNMKKIYKTVRNKLLKKYKDRLSGDDYKNGSEIEKHLIKICFHILEGGKELKMYKEVIMKFQKYYKIHHTNFYKGSNYIPFNIGSTKIKDVISMYIKIPNNTRRNIHCPLHRDSSPSFKIYENDNSYYCFGCHKGGNPANFIADIEGIEYKKAFKKLITLYK